MKINLVSSFEPNLTKKDFYGQKQKKLNIITEFHIFKLVLVPSLSLN